MRASKVKVMKTATGESYYILLPHDAVKLSNINVKKTIVRVKYLNVKRKKIEITYVISEKT